MTLWAVVQIGGLDGKVRQGQLRYVGGGGTVIFGQVRFVGRVCARCIWRQIST